MVARGCKDNGLFSWLDYGLKQVQKCCIFCLSPTLENHHVCMYVCSREKETEKLSAISHLKESKTKCLRHLGLHIKPD